MAQTAATTNAFGSMPRFSSSRDVDRLRYVADDGSNTSWRVRVPGYALTGFSTVIKNHTYRSGYGDPRVASDVHKTFTDLNFAITLKRSSMGVFFKKLIGLYAGYFRLAQSAPPVRRTLSGVVAPSWYLLHTASETLQVQVLPPEPSVRT